MNCKEIQQQLDDFIDEQLSVQDTETVAGHLESCSGCRQVQEDIIAVRAALRDLPVVPASPDFEERVFGAVREQAAAKAGASGHGANRNHFAAGFVTAMAASLMLWFASTVFMPQPEDMAPQTVELAMQQTRTVKLVFEAPRDLADVTLSIALPDNVELEGFSGQKRLVWQTKLNKGQNILALPVIAIDSGEGELVAQLNYGDKSKQFHIVLKTTASGAYMFEMFEKTDVAKQV